jgi:hypothetical protein
LKPSTGELSAIIGMLSAIDRNQCPQSIGTPVRNPRNPQVRTRAAAFGGDFIKVAFETPGRLLDLCTALEPQLESLEEPALAAIDDALPPQSLTLMELSLRVAERRVALARKMDAAANAAAGAPPSGW